MTTAKYLEYDARTHRFSLPAEHAAVAAEGGPLFPLRSYTVICSGKL